MPESFCNSSNMCECQSGRFAIRRNSDCQIRKFPNIHSIQREAKLLNKPSISRCRRAWGRLRDVQRLFRRVLRPRVQRHQPVRLPHRLRRRPRRRDRLRAECERRDVTNPRDDVTQHVRTCACVLQLVCSRTVRKAYKSRARTRSSSQSVMTTR